MAWRSSIASEPDVDDRLRALERAARADPTDRAAAWALVRALEQAGDATGAWRERCRVARELDDDDAWRELTWRPTGLREPGSVVRRQLADVQLVSAGPGAMILVGGGSLLALDPTTLETLWTAPVIGERVCVGPYVAHGHTELVLRLRATGQEVARADPPPMLDAPPGAITRLHASADRILASMVHETEDQRRSCRALFAADDLRLLARIDDTTRAEVAVRDVVLTRGPGFDVIAYPLAGGRARWRVRGVLLTADAEGALVLQQAMTERRLQDGASRWSSPESFEALRSGATWSFGAEVLALLVGGRLSALRRHDGASLWTRPTRPGATLGQVTVGAAAAHALHVAPGASELVTLDLVTGETLSRLQVRLAFERSANASLHAIDGGLIIVESRSMSGGPMVIHRLGASG
jgi:hypothetical protein